MTIRSEIPVPNEAAGVGTGNAYTARAFIVDFLCCCDRRAKSPASPANRSFSDTTISDKTLENNILWRFSTLGVKCIITILTDGNGVRHQSGPASPREARSVIRELFEKILEMQQSLRLTYAARLH